MARSKDASSRTGKGCFQNDFSELKEVVLKMMGKTDENQRILMRALRIQHVWEEVAPEEILEHTDKVYVKKNANTGQRLMIVYIDSPELAADLTARKWRIKMDVEKELGEGPIEDIRFIPSSTLYKKTVFRKQRREQEAENGVDPVLLTEDERRVIENEASMINNEELREALLKARITDAEWKKGIEASKSR